MAAAGFLSHYLSGPLPYVRRHITIKQNVLSASLNKTFPSFLSLLTLISKGRQALALLTPRWNGPSVWGWQRTRSHTKADMARNIFSRSCMASTTLGEVRTCSWWTPFRCFGDWELRHSTTNPLFHLDIVLGVFLQKQKHITLDMIKNHLTFKKKI